MRADDITVWGGRDTSFVYPWLYRYRISTRSWVQLNPTGRLVLAAPLSRRVAHSLPLHAACCLLCAGTLPQAWWEVPTVKYGNAMYIFDATE